VSLYDAEVRYAGRRRIPFRWFLLHPRADYVWAALAVAAWVALSSLLRQPLILEAVAEPARRTLFQTLATLAGTVAGLMLTSVSMLVNVLGKRAPAGQRLLPLERLTAQHRRQIGEIFLFVLPGLASLLVASLATVVLEGGGARGLWLPEAVALGVAVACALGLIRVSWALRRLLAIATGS
jgi:hypothetical protein